MAHSGFADKTVIGHKSVGAGAPLMLVHPASSTAP